MFKSHWLILILFAWGISVKKPPANSTIFPIDKIIDTIHSKILNEDRFIWVHVPASVHNMTKEYPVIFLLDAEANFDETKKILDKLRTEGGAPEAILVGIDNIWLRYRDYSPTRVDSSTWVDAATARTTGGGKKFIAFLEEELLPFIEKKYPVSSRRSIIGHSMGGLQVINIFLKHQQLFDDYVAIDPSMWWDHMKLVNECPGLIGNKGFENKKLFLAIANEPEKRMSMEQVKNDTSAKTVLIRPSFTLADHIQKNKSNNLKFEWKFYKDHHHMTVNAAATYDGLKFSMH
ncbi:MAG TPA: alpha/beta hydrolase-fold protein [Chitinophagaceae bacterium]